MHKLLIALAFLSTSTFAQNVTAPEALTSIVPEGVYRGISPEGRNCSVTVKSNKLNKSASLSVQEGNRTFTRELYKNSSFAANENDRSFQNEIVEKTADGSVKTTLRAGVVNGQYNVSVASQSNTNHTNFTFKVSCNINL